MKKKKMSLVFVVIFLIFVGILDYPFIARIINNWESTGVVVDYQNQVKSLSQEQKDQLLKEAEEYNKALAFGVGADLVEPFSDGEINDPLYKSMLKVSDSGAMASIEIPEIDLVLPIFHSVTDEVLGKGAGHLEGSSLPVGGTGTHACIAAHRGLPTKKLFTNLDQLKEDDVFFIEVLGKKLAYQIYDIETVTPDNIEPLAIEADKDLFTLITCTPYGINSHRIYVHGYRIPYEEAEEATVGSANFWQNYWWAILTVILLIWMLLLLYWFNREPKRRKDTTDEKV